jgi:hypothetical protein
MVGGEKRLSFNSRVQNKAFNQKVQQKVKTVKIRWFKHCPQEKEDW